MTQFPGGTNFKRGFLGIVIGAVLVGSALAVSLVPGGPGPLLDWVRDWVATIGVYILILAPLWYWIIRPISAWFSADTDEESNPDPPQ